MLLGGWLGALLLDVGVARAAVPQAPPTAGRTTSDTATAGRQLRLLLQQGSDAIRRSDYLAATTAAQQALRLTQAPADNPRARFRAMALLGEIAFYRDDLPEAVRWMRQSVAVADALGDWALQVAAYDLLGNSLSENKQCREADRWLRRARDGYQRLHDRSSESLTLVNLAVNELYMQRLPTARAFAEEAVRVARQQKDSARVVNALNNRARVRTAQGEHAQALADGEYALRLARVTGRMEYIQIVLNTMPEFYEQAGRYREALASERRRQQLNDSLNSVDVRHKIAELHTRYRVEQQQARIGALTQQRRIAHLRATQEHTRARLWSVAAVALALLLTVGAWFYRQLRRQRQRLAASETALRQANQTKDQLMSIIGHDLRGPVAGFQQVGLLLRAIAGAPDAAELRAIAAEIDASSTEMGALLDNLLHWGRAQTGQARAFAQATSVAEVVEGVGRLLGPVAQAKGIALRVAVPATLGPAWTDAALLAVVLRNLVSNGIKFTPAGGTVELVVDAPALGYLGFSVRDSGIGLSAERLARLTGLTGAAESTRGTAGEHGTGLGLAVVRHFVSLLGGTLHLTSTPGAGTTASFRLPAAPVEGLGTNLSATLGEFAA